MASPGRTCYNRDGSTITDGAYLPCSNNTSHDSACCGTNHQGVGQTKVADDVCEANGLCQNYEAFDGTNEGVKLWWRQGCTDKTWASPYCLPDVCNSGVWKSQNAPVRQCADNTWCCGEKTCCSATTSIFRLADTVGPLATPTSSVLPTALSSRAATGTSSRIRSATTSGATTTSGEPSATSSTEPKLAGGTGLSTGAKAGIGVAAAVVVILLGIILFLLMKLKRRRKEDGKGLAEAPEQGGHEKPQSTVYAHQVAPVHPVELDGQSRVVEIGDDHVTELPDQRQRLELPGQVQRSELPERGSTVGHGGSR